MLAHFTSISKTCQVLRTEPIDLGRSHAYNAGEMSQPLQLGEFEQVVLLSILRLKEDAYGASIRSEIASCTRREPASGALYTTLDRLEEKGLVTSWFGDPSPQRGGRPKRYLKVTKQGIEAVARAQRAYQRLLRGVALPGATYAQ